MYVTQVVVSFVVASLHEFTTNQSKPSDAQLYSWAGKTTKKKLASFSIWASSARGREASTQALLLRLGQATVTSHRSWLGLRAWCSGEHTFDNAFLIDASMDGIPLPFSETCTKQTRAQSFFSTLGLLDLPALH